MCKCSWKEASGGPVFSNEDVGRRGSSSSLPSPSPPGESGAILERGTHPLTCSHLTLLACRLPSDLPPDTGQQVVRSLRTVLPSLLGSGYCTCSQS